MDQVFAWAVGARSSQPRVRASLLESGDYIAAAREVVAVRTTVLAPTTYTLAPLDEPAFRAFAETWGLGGAADRAVEALRRAS